MILGLCGFIGSGKGTVSKILENKGYKTFSFATPLKDVCASIFGWERKLLEGDTEESRIWRDKVDSWWENELQIKNFTPRLALQLIGTDILRNYFNNDIWVLSIKKHILNINSDKILISDVRFMNELKCVKDLNGKIIHIKRYELPDWWNIALQYNMGDKTLEKEFKSIPIHLSEKSWICSYFDYEIINDDINQLENKIENIIK